MTSHKPEVLAPAGDLESALAALEHGADAVYTGLAQFSARARATSISMNDLARLTQYAHQNHQKIYVAINTLIRDEELSNFVDIAAQLVHYQVDAVILQDLGAIHIFQKFFPQMPIHASTQMSLHNSAALQFAREQKIKRVILERQVSFDELSHMVPHAPVETEVFVHGALCISLSGQCLLSSWQGGCSGNRGQCKQPCRRKWKSEQGNGYFLSPQDLSVIDYVPKLAKLGVTSLKIEGRLRRPDYVSNVTEAFRKAVDAGDNPEKLEEAKAILSRVMGREFTSGFLTKQSKERLIQPEAAGVQGKCIGTVNYTRRGRISIHLSKGTLHCGDRIRIQSQNGEEGKAITVTKIFYKNKQIYIGEQGATIEITTEAFGPSGAGVYCIGKSTKSYAKLAAALPQWHEPVSLNIQLHSNAIQIHAVAGIHRFDWETPIHLEHAEKNPVTEAKIIDEFRISGDPKTTRFTLGPTFIKINGPYFVPNSELKKWRQAFWTAMDTAFQGYSFTNDAILIDIAQYLHTEKRAPLIQQKTTLLRASREIDHRIHADAFAMPVQFSERGEEAYLPSFIPERELPNVQKAIKEAIAHGIRTFRVTSFAAFQLLQKFKSYSLTLYATIPLPIANIASVKWLQTQGVSQFTVWHELELADKDFLITHAPIDPEVCISSRPVLMSIRAHVPTQGLIEDRDETYEVTEPDAIGITRVIPLKRYVEAPSPWAHILMDDLYPDNDMLPPKSFNSKRTWQ